MNKQFAKLLIILNACFWMAVSFGIWHYSTAFPQMVVSTIVVLGFLAVAGNLIFWISGIIAARQRQARPHVGIFTFILLSTLAQILLLLYSLP